MKRDVKAIVKEMTLEEKAGMCSGKDFWHLKGVERLGIPEVMVSDGPHGLRKQAEEADHLGLNESIKAVCFPTACATACSFDRDLLQEMGERLGEECQAEDVSVILGPAVNIKRSPLCGRNFEYFSEDPYLASQMAAAHIKGVQSKNVGTSIKHFAANNQEHRRMSCSSEIDERTFREIYLGAFETAIKEAKPDTVYRRKGVAPERAKIVVCSENFHGRTITIISMSTDPSSYADFGPYTPGFIKIPYNNVDALAEALKDPDAVGFLVEPIQGEAGVVVPDDGYLRACYDLCHQKNVLFIADEIQTGIGRTGKLLACDYEGIRPDILILGKALSGGVSPVSAVLADDEIMLTIAPGEHGSTYGGNPLAAKVAIAALEVVRDEHLSENAFKMGELFRGEMERINNPMIKKVRGKGLLNAVVTEPKDGKTAWDICLALKENGLIAKPTHDHIIRFTPPLVITEEQMMEAIGIIRDTFAKF